MTPKDSHRTKYAVRRADALSAAKLYPDYFHPERLGAIRAISEAYEGDRCATLLSIADFRRDQRQIRPGDEYLGLANSPTPASASKAQKQMAKALCSSMRRTMCFLPVCART
jgi:hypothetical protein